MRFTKTIATASVAAVLGLGGVSVAGAASTGSSTPSSNPTSSTAQKPAADKPDAKKPARAVRRRHVIRKGVVASAKTIGIKPLDLAKELRSGKTIAQVATAHGVQPQAVIDALETAATARIDKAAGAGKITAERAAKLKTRLDKVAPKFVNDWHVKSKTAAG